MKVRCPRCGRELNLSQAVPGLEVRCPVCREKLTWENGPAGAESGAPMHAAPPLQMPASPAVHAGDGPQAAGHWPGARASRGRRYAAAAAALAVLTVLAAQAGRLAQIAFDSVGAGNGPAVSAAPPGDDTSDDPKFPGNRILPTAVSYITPMELVRSAPQPNLESIRGLLNQQAERERAERVRQEREQMIAKYENDRQQAKAEEERQQAEVALAEMLRQKEAERQERLAFVIHRRDEVVAKKDALESEISSLERAIGDDQARWEGLNQSAMYARLRAAEWQRQQFFDVNRQMDTLNMRNAPLFLWSPQILERRYNYEWRRFDGLHS